MQGVREDAGVKGGCTRGSGRGGRGGCAGGNRGYWELGAETGEAGAEGEEFGVAGGYCGGVS